MAICIKCGKESQSCLCDVCVKTADLEALCEEIMEYRLGSGENELWDKMASGCYSPYNFKSTGFAVAEYLPSPRKEYRKILSLAGNSCSVPKNSRKWLYEVYESCKNSSGLSEAERNRLRGLVTDALYKDYEFAAADKMAAEMRAAQSLPGFPKQAYLTMADFYTTTRRYDAADEILAAASKVFANDADAVGRIREACEKNKKYREKAVAGKQEYMPNPNEKREEAKQKSIRFSPTISVLPKPLQISCTSERSSLETFALGHIPIMPSPTIAGVFGMVRMILTGFSNSSSSHLRVLPGAIVTIIFSCKSRLRICPMTS